MVEMTTTEVILILGFIVLIILAIVIAVAIFRMCGQISQTLSSVQKQIDDLDHEPKRLIHNANEISENVHDKLTCFDPLFRSVERIGEGIEYSASRYRDETLQKFLGEQAQKKEEEEQYDDVAEAIELVLKGVNLFYKFKKRS